MIDTDKYENAQVWVVSGNTVLDARFNIPLLLAEVKRLREAFITAVNHVGEPDLSRDDLFSKLDDDLFSLWLFRSE